jgi:cellulose synthase (UDP-forming)
MPEAELVLTAEKTWGMIAFSFLAFIMAVGGVLAALEARRLSDEESWANIDLDKIKTASDI